MKKDTNVKVTDRREGIVKLINEREYAGKPNISRVHVS